MIFGRPGSGKSTFANHLGKTLNLPVYHLDKIFYTHNWVERDKQEFLSLQQKMVNLDNWIINGNATKSLEMRYAKADIAIYFLFPRITCLRRIIKRRFTKNNHIDDRALNCPEKISWKLIWYMWTFNWRAKKTVANLQQKYPQTKFYLIKSDHELTNLWRELVPKIDVNLY